MYFVSYEFLFETALYLVRKLQTMFELVWAIGLDKNYENFTVECWWCVEMFWKFSWILDVYFRSYKFSIGTALFSSLISVTVLILFWKIYAEKIYQNVTVDSLWYWVVFGKLLWILVVYAISNDFWGLILRSLVILAYCLNFWKWLAWRRIKKFFYVRTHMLFVNFLQNVVMIGCVCYELWIFKSN